MSYRTLRFATPILLALLFTSFARAVEKAPAGDDLPADATESEVLAGHSYHGEFLNEGPRQSAYLMSGTGSVDFPVTSTDENAKAFVEQGLGQFYGFWYLESERSFRHAANLDPDCAMAYWGAALATKKNTKRSRGFIAKAVELKEKVSKREAMYIEALDGFLNYKPKQKKTDKQKSSDADKEEEKPLTTEQKKSRAEVYTKALEDLALEFPDDIEAKALLALQLYENKRDLPNPSYLAVDGLLDKVFMAEPNHSAHHFRIHLWDNKKPAIAVPSAEVCGIASPAIAHMWHMPGHIYSRLRRYNDAAWQQEASARVDHAHMIRDRVMPDQIHNFAHNNEWLIRNLNHVGRVSEAVALAKNMIELPRHPKYNTLEKRGSAHYGRARLIETLRRFELWEQAIQLSGTAYLQPTDKESEQINRLRLVGVASINTGKYLAADRILRGLNKRLQEKRQKQKAAGDKAVAEAKKKAVNDETVKKATNEARQKAEKELKADAPKRSAMIECIIEKAATKSRLEQLKKAKKQIDKARTDGRKPLATPINDLVKAIAEMETHLATQAGAYDQALEHAKKAGRNISPQMLTSIQMRCGDPKAAIEKAKKEVERSKGQVHPLASLLELYYFAADIQQAKKTLTELATVGAFLDTDCKLYDRISTIAKSLGATADWRSEKEQQNFATRIADETLRPNLDSLGPFRWSPSAAPQWTLKDSDDQSRSLDDYKGKPLIAIFYLGYGCLHCAEQLQAFGPMHDKFAQAGISFVAISSDNDKGLKKSIELYDGKKFPFPLISDSSLDTFRSYRAYDDFEQQPLHGTFLIDSNGLVRWQDISYEPFMEPEFLLEEAKRLLAAH